ncbi:hypothetical protein HY483_00095 [Candidatus Woesearchaeota archaeon]|nr:hypothetical protein [Candidatus Woesearchaeota archaeon]
MNVNQEVWKVLRTDSALQKDLTREIINMRALAKYLIDKYHYKASLDAVISAIRRYQSQEEYKEEDKKLEHIFSESVVSTKNNMACITLSLTARQTMQKLSNDKNNKKIKLITGTEVVKLLIEQPYLKETVQHFTKEDITGVDQNISEIRVVVSPEGIKTKGVLAKLATEIALANINIKEILVCPPEFFIYVHQDDIVKAHASIIQLCKDFLG